MRSLVRLLTVLWWLPGGAALEAQDTGVLRGRVTDAVTGEPVADARVAVEGTTFAGLSSANGEYALAGVSAGRHLVTVRRVGYAVARQEVDVVVGGGATLDVALRAAAVGLDAIVVTGVGVPVERKVLGNTIETVTGDVLNDAPGAGAVDQALQGKVTGAVISQSTGVPGGGISVRLRGTSTILGNAEPLWVVDGVIVDNSSEALVSLGANAGRGNAALSNRLSDIPSADIDRVEVLKGAAAAALYGSRANSGVIQVFTKRGRSGTPRVSAGTDVEIGETPKRFEFNMAPTAGYNDVLLGAATALGQPVQRYDIQDSVWRMAVTSTSRLAVSGGAGGTSYYLSGNYAVGQGIVRSTDRRRTAIAARLNQQVRSNLALSVNGSFIQSRSHFLPEGEQTQGALTSLVFTATSFKPFFDANLGRYPYDPVLGPNPLYVLHNVDAPQEVTRFIGGAEATLTPIRAVTIRYLIGLDDYRQEDKYLLPPGSTSATFTGQIQNPVRHARQFNNDLTVTHAASIVPSLRLTSTVGYRYTDQRADVVRASATDLPPEQTTVGGATQSASQTLTELRTSGGFVEERASFRDRLFVTGGLNLEAASAFGPDQRWQLYPRISGSWLLSEEPFFKDGPVGRRINSLRLRLAYGETGGQPPTFYGQFNNYVNVAYAGKPGLVPSSVAGNASLRPERQREIEGGLDAGLFQDRAQLELTYYQQRTSDLVLGVPLPPSSGQSTQFQNIGALRNRGWEAALTTVNASTPSFGWRTRLSLGHNANRVEKLLTRSDTLLFDYLNAVIEGQPIGVFWGGYYARNADGSIAYEPRIVTTLGKTDTLLLPLRAVDTLASGTTVGRNKVIGDPNPKLVASLSNTVDLGRRVQLNVLLDGRFGNKVANFTRRITELFGVDKVVEREIAGDTVFRTFSRNPAGRSLIYEEYIEDGTFVKLREIALSIRFDQAFVKRVGAETMDLRIAARNLHTWTSYRGLDPEVNLFSASTVSRGVDFANTPIPRSFVVSVNFTF